MRKNRPYPVRLALALSVLALSSAALPAQIIENYVFSPGLAVPDGSSVGITDSRTLNSAITSITDVTVTLNISGGFNGDYYVYLVHTTGAGTGFSILLNRVGTTSGNPFGYLDSGVNISLSSVAANDIHLYQNNSPVFAGGALTGTWQPDGRTDNPLTVTDASPRSAFLDSFANLDANGVWSLFVADLSPVGSGTLVSWGMTIRGVPEPGTVAAGVLGALAAAGALHRRRQRK